LAELGKVEKTIYLCEYLSSLELIHAPDDFTPFLSFPIR
jgi:hypothetical protein